MQCVKRLMILPRTASCRGMLSTGAPESRIPRTLRLAGCDHPATGYER